MKRINSGKMAIVSKPGVVPKVMGLTPGTPSANPLPQRMAVCYKEMTRPFDGKSLLAISPEMRQSPFSTDARAIPNMRTVVSANRSIWLTTELEVVRVFAL